MDKDLCYAAAPYDNEFNDLRHLLAGITRGLYGFFGKVGTPRDKTRILMAWIVVALLLVSISVIYTIERVALRMAVVVSFLHFLLLRCQALLKPRLSSFLFPVQRKPARFC